MDDVANDNAAPAPPRRGRCPICGKPADPSAAPFCSKRCADVDLHRWLGEGYGIPVDLGDDLRDSPDEP